MKIYSNNITPKRDKDLRGYTTQESVDVITYDEHGILNTAWYDYEQKKWMFHTDTVVDPYEHGEIYDFVWMYKPEQLSLENKLIISHLAV